MPGQLVSRLRENHSFFLPPSPCPFSIRFAQPASNYYFDHYYIAGGYACIYWMHIADQKNRASFQKRRALFIGGPSTWFLIARNVPFWPIQLDQMNVGYLEAVTEIWILNTCSVPTVLVPNLKMNGGYLEAAIQIRTLNTCFVPKADLRFDN